MRAVFTKNEVRSTEEQFCLQSGKAASQLVEEASQKISRWILEFYRDQDSEPARVFILKGSGNNGQDAELAGQILKTTWQKKIEFITLELSDFSTDFQVQFKSDDLIVDGLFGLSFRGQLPYAVQRVFTRINKSKAVRISLDLPSGAEADTGRVSPAVFHAHHTLCLGLRKIANVHGEALAYSGKIHFLKMSFSRAQSQIYQWTLKDTLKNLPTRSASAHKGSGGRVLCLAREGALSLAGEAAQRMGVSGILFSEQMIAPKTWLKEFPDWMLWRQKDFSGVNAVLIGPNWGFSDQAKTDFEYLREFKGPVVCDADALRILARSRNLKVNSNWVLTPHLGEMSELISESSEWILNNPQKALQKAHQLTGAIVLVKGFKTWVYDGKRFFIVSTGNRSLAKAGSGDVLSGMIAGLMAQGFVSPKAAVVGASLHGYLGDRHIKKRRDYVSLRSYDLIQDLPEALSGLRQRLKT